MNASAGRRAVLLLGRAGAGGARGEAAEDLGQRAELRGAQLVEEALLHRGEMRGLCRTGEVEPGVREGRVRGARVRRRGRLDDEPAALQLVGDPRDPAEAQRAERCQLREPEAALGCGGEAAQGLQRAEGEAVLGLELALERARERLVRLQQPDPGVRMRLRPAGDAVVPDDVCTRG